MKRGSGKSLDASSNAVFASYQLLVKTGINWPDQGKLREKKKVMYFIVGERLQLFPNHK